MMNRKEFLKIGGLTVGSLLLGNRMIEQGVFDYNPVSGFSSNKNLTIDGAIELYRQLDKVADHIEDIVPPGPSDLDAMYALMYEVVPYFQHEGIQAATLRRRSSSGYAIVTQQAPVYPDIQMYAYPGTVNFHLLGQANCHETTEHTVSLNLRYFNPWSTLYAKSSVITTLVHELAHMQKASCDLQSADNESATQIVTCEVLAAATRTQSQWAFPAFVGLVSGFVSSFIMLYFVEQNDLEGYFDVMKLRADHAFQEGTLAKSIDYWKDNIRELKYILREYGAKPYIYLAEAMSAEDVKTRKFSIPNASGTVLMDDTKWVLANVHKLARAYTELLADYA